MSQWSLSYCSPMGVEQRSKHNQNRSCNHRHSCTVLHETVQKKCAEKSAGKSKSAQESARSFTGQDVFEDDLDVVVTVWARVLVPEADDVAELVNDDAELVAVLADRDRLRTVAALSHERTAPATRDVNKAGSFKAKARSLKAKAKAKARDQG